MTFRRASSRGLARGLRFNLLVHSLRGRASAKAAYICVLALGTMLAPPAGGTVKTENLPQYDPSTVMDFAATVLEVREVPKDNPLSGVNLLVKMDSDATIGIYLAPADFFRSFEIAFRKGDMIHVIGSRVKFAGENILLAREVRRDSATIYLRDRNGQPYWLLMGKPPS